MYKNSPQSSALLWGVLSPRVSCDVIRSGLDSDVHTELRWPRLRNVGDRPVLCLSIAPTPCMTVL